jgi:hypothetical protein
MTIVAGVGLFFILEIPLNWNRFPEITHCSSDQNGLVRKVEHS